MAKLPKGGLTRFVAWVNGEEVVDDLKHEHHKHKKPFSFFKHFPRLSAEQRVLGYRILGVAICSIFVLILLATVSKLPTFGSPNNPASNEVVERYIESGIEETGAVNLVAGMILDYRAFDTFGESNVLFLAVISVVMLLKRDKNNFDEDDEKILNEDEDLDDEDDNIILKRFTMLVFPLITLYGVYVILNGHLSPGGGFSGGAIIGAGLILFDTAFGQNAVRKFFNFKRFTYISVGCLLTYCACKSYSFFTGANHLPNIIPKGIPGNILSGGLILPLNICVGLIVACTMYGFYALFTRGEI